MRFCGTSNAAVIVHVVDVSVIEGRDPKSDFEKINEELARFSEELADRPQIVAANKADIASEEQIAEFKKFIQEKNLEYFTISAATKKGIQELLNCIVENLDKLPPVKSYEPEPLSLADLEEIEKKRQEFKVEKSGKGYFTIYAQFLEPIIAAANMDDYESLQYLQRVLRSSGIIDALEEAGVREGDTVAIFDFEFEYVS
jgi:GTP-binding protein